MAGIEDLFSMFGGQSPQQTAVTSTPTDFKALFGSILESVAAEAKRKADPVQRLYDVGGAIFDSASTGSPFSRNLAALDAERNKAVTGAGNMFLNVLGMERQLEQLKGEERRHTERLSLDRERLKETTRQHDTTAALTIRGQDIGREERTASRREAADVRAEQDHDTTRKTLSGATKDVVQFNKLLDENPEYVMARKARDWEKANKIAGALAESVGTKTDLPADLRIRDVAYQNVGDAAKEMQDLLKTGPSAIDPTDRARMRQLWSKMVLQYGIATGRGANYTELEKQFVTDILGQSPTDLRYRTVESLGQFQNRLRIFQEGMAREQQNLRGSGARNAPAASPNWRGEPEMGPKVETRGPGYEIQAPPGWKPTGRTMPDGRPIFTDGVNEAAPPKR